MYVSRELRAIFAAVVGVAILFCAVCHYSYTESQELSKALQDAGVPQGTQYRWGFRSIGANKLSAGLSSRTATVFLAARKDGCRELLAATAAISGQQSENHSFYLLDFDYEKQPGVLGEMAFQFLPECSVYACRTGERGEEISDLFCSTANKASCASKIQTPTNSPFLLGD